VKRIHSGAIGNLVTPSGQRLPRLELGASHVSRDGVTCSNQMRNWYNFTWVVRRFQTSNNTFHYLDVLAPWADEGTSTRVAGPSASAAGKRARRARSSATILRSFFDRLWSTPAE